MFYAVEIFAPSEKSVDSYPMGRRTSLTPQKTLTQSLDSGLPKLFHLGTVQHKPAALSCVGLILPVVAAGGLRACVSLIWRVDADFAAALEVWRPDASGALRLGDAYYGAHTPFQETSTKTFEQLSRQMSFGVLEGLPGETFDALEPVIFETLSHTRGFVRSEAAAAAGLSAGLGIPVLKHKTASCAVLLLSSEGTPLARTFEVWRVAGRKVNLASSRTLNATENAAADPTVEPIATPCAGAATQVAKTKLPQISRCGERVRVGVPIFRGKEVGSVVVLEG
jgi:hypothetical protein